MAGVKKRGGGRRNPSNQTSGTSQTVNHRPANLPPQYTFTPANHRVPETDSQGTPVPNLQPPARPTPSYRDYPPPTNLFQHSRSFTGTSPSGKDPTRRPFPQPLASATNPPEFSSQLRESPQPSQAQNSHEEEADSEDDGARESNLPADVLASLHDMLVQPGREKYTTVLSPSLERGTTW
ncbi:PREDICTED: nipped-B-like protein A [Camelina sativa]|uniref:Nipped-B-like protein A n=1 Tax=Camelina sativa TaxID=90675 RepID=A0ABM0XS99_CAMSA|nr:PREDICTED: nipped-B-like protein A [Camelina sativa]